MLRCASEESASSDTVAYYPEASPQAGPLSKQHKRRCGHAPGRPPPPAPNFALSPLLHPVSLSPATTRLSRAASRLSSHNCGPALATSAPTRRISNPIDSCALAAVSQKPKNTSSSTARSTPALVQPSLHHSDSNHHPLPTCSATLVRQRQPSGSSPTRAALIRSTLRPQMTRLVEFAPIIPLPTSPSPAPSHIYPSFVPT